MKKLNLAARVLLLIAALTAQGAFAQTAPAQSAAQAAFSREELAQMLAPIALYPDALLTQILMASTYPLEVVEANRWMAQQNGLAGDALDSALARMDWDPSVKALCHYPSVLAEMDRDLARTTRLGNAFLAQQTDVMDTVQELRHKALKAGTLKSSPEQRVGVDGAYVTIALADLALLFVPYYDPLWAYGPWWYPAYQPYVWFPGYYAPGSFVFSQGYRVNEALTNWALANWAVRAVMVRPGLAPFGRTAPGGAGAMAWTHNPAHRRGVAYLSPAVTQRFGGGVFHPQSPAQGAFGGSAFSPAARGFAVPGGGISQPGLPGRPGGRVAGPGARPVGPVGSGRTGAASHPTPFTGLGSHGSGFEARAVRRGAALPGGSQPGAPSFRGGGVPAFRGGTAPAVGRGGGAIHGAGGGVHGGGVGAPASVFHGAGGGAPAGGGGGFHGGGFGGGGRHP